MTEVSYVIGRRERKKLTTRAALHQATIRLVARHGVPKVTVERIATEADIAVRTFYNYFSTREEAMVAPLGAGAEMLVDEFRARPKGESVLQAVREAALHVLQGIDTAGWEQVEALQQILRAPSLAPQRLAVFAAQEQTLANAVAERVTTSSRQEAAVPSDGYPRLCAASALTVMRVTLDQWLDQSTNAGSTPDGVPDIAILREQAAAAFGQLAAGLDWPPAAG